MLATGRSHLGNPGLKLIQAYYGISNPALRKIVFGLIEALADN